MSNTGKHVKVHYTGTLDDGTKFDSSYDRGKPLEFECMAGQMIPGFDKAVDEMEVGEKRTVKIPAADAYGEYDEDLVKKLDKRQFAGSENLKVGMRLSLGSPSGAVFPAKVVAIDDESVTFDLNSEFAGKDLTFEIELLSAE